jgi:anaerobic magnesium-protoporphyrin IX monomethyl ester cyclase
MKKDKINLVLANLWHVPAKTPHFGLATLAAYIRQENPNVNISIVEGMDIVEEIIQKKPDIVGFTSDTLMYNRIVKLAKKIKEKISLPLLIGGVHITALPSSLDPVFELGIQGEGEKTISELLRIFKEEDKFPKKSLMEIPGLAFFEGKDFIDTGRPPLITDIDKLPFAARDLTPMEEVYLKDQFNLFGSKRTVAIMTSRGCPYKCRFCGSPAQWERARFHSAEYVVAEIEHLVDKYQADGIMFWDDLFIAPEARIFKISELIRSKGLDKKIVFTGFGRANLINEKVCVALRAMNVKRLIFGLESGSEKILDYLKKSSVTVEDNRRAVTLCRKYGITTSSGYIVGTPGETVEDLKETFHFMKKYPLDNTQIYILTPYPGTEIWETAKKKGIIDDKTELDALFVQLGRPTPLDFLRDGKSKILEGRIFLNAEYKNNREYKNIIFGMTKLAFWQNMKFYFKRFPYELDLIGRVILGKIRNVFFKNSKTNK